MALRNAANATWEVVTPSDTVTQNYYGVSNGGAAAATIVLKSEATGADITLTLAAGTQWLGRVVLVKATGTSGTVLGAKAI